MEFADLLIFEALKLWMGQSGALSQDPDTMNNFQHFVKDQQLLSVMRYTVYNSFQQRWESELWITSSKKVLENSVLHS